MTKPQENCQGSRAAERAALRDTQQHSATRSLYEMIRKQIEHEDNLINHRLTWLLFSQGFLFFAYTTLASSDKPKKLPILWVVAAVGYTLSLSAFFSIKAAFQSLSSLSRKWEEHSKNIKKEELEQYPSRIRLEDRVGLENKLGSAWGIPLLTMLAWAFLLSTALYSGSTPIFSCANISAAAIVILALVIFVGLVRNILGLYR